MAKVLTAIPKWIYVVRNCAWIRLKLTKSILIVLLPQLDAFKNFWFPEWLVSKIIIFKTIISFVSDFLASNYLLKENIVFEQSLANAKPKVWTCILLGLLYISNTVKFDQKQTSQHLAIHLPEGPQKYGLWRVLDCKKCLSMGFNNLFFNFTLENPVVK